MASQHHPPPHERSWLRRALPIVGIGVLILGLLAAMPGAWALPEQSPDFQTVPTITPAPTSPPPQPPPPTDTPAPAPPTNTPEPAGTVTSSPTRTVQPATATPVGPNPCWAVPTPGFVAEPLPQLVFRALSDQSLVTPGQSITLRLTVENTGSSALSNILICNPLAPTLVPGTPVTSQGRARLEPQGLLVELGALAPGQTAQVQLTLDIPLDHPPGEVIENQAWLFAGGQRASTDLWTWALPPAYLPPTGRPHLGPAGATQARV